MIILFWFIACTPNQPANDTGHGFWYGDWSGSTPTGTEPNGGLSLVTGTSLAELAWLRGPTQSCGNRPTLLLTDLTGDDLPELGMSCRNPEDGWRVDLHILDGGAVLGGSLSTIARITGRSHGATALGDLDGDGLPELGFGIPSQTLNGIADLEWWWVRPGHSIADGPPIQDTIPVLGEGGNYGSGPPIPIGDVDGDGVVDLAVWQVPGTTNPVLHLLSGAQVGTSESLNVTSQSMRSIPGLEREQMPGDMASTSDVNGDGFHDIALNIVDGSQQYGVGPVSSVAVLWGDDLSDPADGLRIEGSFNGRDRHGQVEDLGDLDGDGLNELAVLLTVFTSSEDGHAELAVIPGAALAAGANLSASAYALGGVEGQPHWLETCDLDGDGLPELILGDHSGAIWNGTDLLTPGALPLNSIVEGIASCIGDLDGFPGEELVLGRQDTVTP